MSIRIQLHSPAIKAFLRSGPVASVLEGPAERIKSQADAGLSSGTGHTVEIKQGYKDRVVAIVRCDSIEAKYAEMDSRNLTHAVEAGRG